MMKQVDVVFTTAKDVELSGPWLHPDRDPNEPAKDAITLNGENDTIKLSLTGATFPSDGCVEWTEPQDSKGYSFARSSDTVVMINYLGGGHIDNEGRGVQRFRVWVVPPDGGAHVGSRDPAILNENP